MKTKSFILRGAVLAIVSLLPQVHAEPRVPLPALPSMALGLYHNRFDEAYWFGKERSETVQSEAGTLVESWSGYALQRAGINVMPFVVPAVGERGQLNVACDFGSVGFWFKPYWTSGAVKSGSEPGVPARLVDLVVLGAQDAAIGWSLQVSADGNALVLVGANGERVLGADIAWSAGEWHWIVLNYGTKGTALYVDEAWVAEGDVTMVLPASYSGLVLGSSVMGDETAGGEFEDFYCYRKPMTASQPGFGYAGMKKRTLAGVVTAEEVAALAKRRTEAKTLRDAQLLLEPEEEGGGGMMMRMMTGLVDCVTNSPLYITNTTSEFVTNQGWTVTFDVQGTNGPVDIFTTTNFLGGTNTQWTWLENGPTCATYQYTNQHAGQSFYILGTTNDTDSDGLTDAYEKLVSKTLVSTNDTDGDLMPDAWEVNNGLNPLVDDAGDDPDGDWLTNLAEYNGGTNSTNPRDVMVVAWGDNFYGQCNVPSDLREVVAVAAGFDFSLALRKDGSVVGWGSNTYGQTNIPAGLTNVSMLSAQWWDGAALKTDGTMKRWGASSWPVPTWATNLSRMSVGYDYVLGLQNSGTVISWGQPSYRTNLISGLTNIVEVAASIDHKVALRNNGSVVAWGLTYDYASWNLTNVPASATNVSAIAVGGFHTLALKANGTVVAWGAGNAPNPPFNYLGAESGQSIVPSGLSNVIAVAAGGNHSLALRSVGSVVGWGDMASPSYLQSGITAIAAGANHNLAIRSGRQMPLILQSPVGRPELPGSTVTYTSLGLGLAGVKYQWQFNGTNITGQTNATLTVNTISTNQVGSYTVVISTGAGSITSSVATLSLIGPPVITNTVPLAPSTNWITNGVTTLFQMFAQATALATDRYPLRYQWFTNGVAITGSTNQTYNITPSWTPLWHTNPADADYTVEVSNPAGTNESSAWTVRVVSLPKEGSTVAWGNNSDGQIEYPALTNTLAIAAGELHSVAVQEDGSVVQWGTNWANVPADLTNAVAVAASYNHSLALRSDGTVTFWGFPWASNAVPTNLSGVKAIAAGVFHNLAALTNGNVTAWGYNFPGFWNLTDVPASATNVTAVAAGYYHSLALKSDGTVVSWGYNGGGQTNVPNGLSNVVAIAAGELFSLALKADGTISAWGDNWENQLNMPAGLSNVMAIAAGRAHGAALKNDGTVVCWGGNSSGQTNTPLLTNVKMIAAGGDHTLAAVYSPLVQYPVDVSKDLLLIYNTNSVASAWVMNYYRTNRPMVSGANVLGVGCTTNEVTTSVVFTNEILTTYLTWLTNNPTKHPQYIVTFIEMPSIVNSNEYTMGSLQVVLHSKTPGIRPFLTSINMGSTNDCKGYIDKVATIAGTNQTAIEISANQSGYANTNYYFDDIREDFTIGYTEIVFASDATNTLQALGISPSSIHYATNGVSHLRNCTNVAGYFSWGVHGGLTTYPTNSAVLSFSGASGWFLIETIESYNGLQSDPWFGTYTQWFSANAFGGGSYSNTPVGAVCHVQEPIATFVNNAGIYFGKWSQEKRFSTCAWNSRRTPFMMAVGDPFVRR